MAFPVGFQYYNPHKKANYTTSKNGKYQVFYEALDGATEKPFALDLFDISIINNSTNKPVNNTQKNTAYVLLSKGQTDQCFWDNKGTSLEANTAIPTDNTKYNYQASYANGQFDTLQIYQGYSKSFDNLVRYRTLGDMVGQAYKSQESAQGLYSRSLTFKKSGYFIALPIGTMVLFYLRANQIPQGWQICNGTNGIPDMRGYFAMGANGDYDNTLFFYYCYEM